jgi:hypothetical protein
MNIIIFDFATLNDFRLKIVFLAAIVVLAILRYLFIQRDNAFAKRVVEWSTIPLVIVAIFSFMGKNPSDKYFLNHHDTYHYYFGAKYSDVIDPFQLYDCTAQALAEVSPGALRSVTEIRDLRTYEMIETKEFLEKANCKDLLPVDRWESFRADIAAFQRLRSHNWSNYLGDKGYNATPVWNMLGHTVANLISVEPFDEFNIQGVLDWFLIGGAFIMAYAAFGVWAPSVAILLFVGSYEWTSTFIRGSLLRLPWLALLIAGLSAIKLRRYSLAGVFLATTFMLRIFSGLFLFGPAVLAAREFYLHRRLPTRYIKLFGAAAITCGMLFGASVAYDGSIKGWTQWAEKIEVHSRAGGAWRIGLSKVILATNYYYNVTIDCSSQWAENIKEGIGSGNDSRVKWKDVGSWCMQTDAKQVEPKIASYYRLTMAKITIGLVLLVSLAWGISGLRFRGIGRGTPLTDVEAVALSFPVIFALLTPTFYYYCFLMVVALGLADSAYRVRPLILLVAIALMECSFHLIPQLIGFGIAQFIIYSFLVLGLSGLTITLLMRPDPAVAKDIPRSA